MKEPCKSLLVSFALSTPFYNGTYSIDSGTDTIGTGTGGTGTGTDNTGTGSLGLMVLALTILALELTLELASTDTGADRTGTGTNSTGIHWHTLASMDAEFRNIFGQRPPTQNRF